MEALLVELDNIDESRMRLNCEEAAEKVSWRRGLYGVINQVNELAWWPHSDKKRTWQPRQGCIASRDQGPLRGMANPIHHGVEGQSDLRMVRELEDCHSEE